MITSTTDTSNARAAAASTPATATTVSTATTPSSVQAFAQAFEQHLARSARPQDPLTCLQAAADVCQASLQTRWVRTQADDRKAMQAVAVGQARRVHYLSMEFLMGRALANALAAVGLAGAADRAMAERGSSLGALVEHERDAALGNGGLGRLAACFLDSMAELGLPAFGYGLRYRFGMFAQRIEGGRQVEVPDDWLTHRNPWETERAHLRYPVGFGGSIKREGAKRIWTPAYIVHAQAVDFIVPAHHSARVATLRQWQPRAEQPLDFEALTRGDHAGAALASTRADALSWVLYPDDSTTAGRELRLRQEAFLVSASLQDMMARHLDEGGTALNFAERNAIHLNDTHPALAPLELMRLLLDEHDLTWAKAWSITQAACSYTNHTLMPEALETWPVWMFEAILPRHLDIAYQINADFLRDMRLRFPGDEGLVRRVSLIAEDGERRIRMGTLSILAARRVNGVSALHSQLMVDTLFADFARLYPGRFFNVTNGVTPRRWLAQANPSLAALLDERLTSAWRTDLSRLSSLREHAPDDRLGERLLSIKQANKHALARWLQAQHGISVDAHSMFDVQIKRIHEYKRQLLNLLHVVARWQAIVANPDAVVAPRTVIIAGKAASAYRAAKLIVRLANDIATTVNADARLQGKLKLVFIPDYGVHIAERVIPAADLSEQISTAGTEASGTGNMKFSLNGALTIGTWDGANIEMGESMGPEHMFVFGLRAHEVAAQQRQGHNPMAAIERTPALARAIEAIASGVFSPDEPHRYTELTDHLRQYDRYLVTADFAGYVRTQESVDALYLQPKAWAARVVHNVAGMGPFSSDRAIAEYVQHVWARPAS
jgi:glycogen phosphorylase